MPKRHSRRGKIRLTGLGLDNQDGHTRITRSRQFRLYSGSAGTHERMQAQALEFFEHGKRRGLSIDDISRGECRAILAEMGLREEDSHVA